MNTEIYYFSGTGNSLFVAKEIQKRIPDSTIIPIVSLLKNDVIETRGKIIGFVFPVHALTIPIVVKKFIKQIRLDNSEYVFAVATRAGTVFRGFEAIDKLLKKKRKRINSQFVLNMCSNDSRHEKYVEPNESDISLIEKEVLKQIGKIACVINNKKIYKKKDSKNTIIISPNPITRYIIERIVISAINIAEFFGGVNYFYYDNKCIGCSICEKVCPSGKIVMQKNKPVWRKHTLCYMCFACLNFCPSKSVQIHDIPGVKSFTKENGRYNHPYATSNDMLLQKKRLSKET